MGASELHTERVKLNQTSLGNGEWVKGNGEWGNLLSPLPITRYPFPLSRLMDKLRRIENAVHRILLLLKSSTVTRNHHIHQLQLAGILAIGHPVHSPEIVG